MDKVKLGIIGLGARGETLLATLKDMPDVEVTAIFDLRQERVEFICRKMAEYHLPAPTVHTSAAALIDDPDVQGVLIPTSWNSHLHLAEMCMKRGKYAGVEVGGAGSLEELWHLVFAAEDNGGKCMMLENTCYGRDILMALNMARKGVFGELIYCECGYEHDISEMAWNHTRVEREMHNRNRNGDLYPTHGLGPLAKILRINRGNRFLTVSSTATKGRGFELAAAEHGVPNKHYNAGDMTVTVIRCANGETIMMRHCISLPRPHSIDWRVQGTKGIWLDELKSIHTTTMPNGSEYKIDIAGNPYLVHNWAPVQNFYEEYDHPLWKKYANSEIGGHGGMDYLTLSAFADAIRRNVQPPIDVYDVAAWMSITTLSEQSVAMGGQVLPCPDFTSGRWIDREPDESGCWGLNEIVE